MNNEAQNPLYSAPAVRERIDARSVFHFYMDHHNDNPNDFTFDIPARSTTDLLGTGDRYRLAMLELQRHISNYGPITKCWLFCIVSLPDWNYVIRLPVENENENEVVTEAEYVEDDDQDENQFETLSTVANSRFVLAIGNVTLEPMNDLPICTNDNLTSFKERHTYWI
ncbi:unnamed protein product [Ambrosiozyma monospora]|uniref:Unnamed protein product n=1 Tax=Ambrosiozyma monospora TaxID=43982 RepID=A0ACB5SUS6_AMBMO|nr:unnamed protein product [Ambrosiozyma monospora]